jgi:hypothetical protein
MTSPKPGLSTSKPEVASVSKHGFWLVVNGTEYFLPFEKFPWFRGVSEAQLGEVELLHDAHLYWATLDVDLSLAIIDEPEKYRLVWQ